MNIQFAQLHVTMVVMCLPLYVSSFLHVCTFVPYHSSSLKSHLHVSIVLYGVCTVMGKGNSCS